MKLQNLIAGTLLMTAIMASCQKDNYGAPDKDKYVYDIPQTPVSSDVITGAYYTAYTTAVQQAKSPEEPLLGWYTTQNPGVMEQHLIWADKAGLDFFIFTWNGASTDDDLIARFNDAHTGTENVKYIIRYNTAHLELNNDNPLESDHKYRSMLSEFVDILAGYMQSDTYYKIDGRPVLMMTPANLGSDVLLSINFKSVTEKLKSDLKSFFGMEPYLIGEMTTGWVAPVNYADHQVYSFDGLCLRDWKTRSYDLFYSYFSFLDINWNNWNTTLSKRDVDFIPCIYPSYNDRVNTPSSYYYTFSEDGDTDDFVNFCNVAKRNMGKSGIVLMNSWNDWVNGTNLEPSVLKEESFLETAKSQFKL